MDKLLNNFSNAVNVSYDATVKAAKDIKAYSDKHPMSVCLLNESQAFTYNFACKWLSAAV